MSSENTVPATDVRPYPFERYSVTEIPPVYAELRKQCPVAELSLPSGDRGWIITPYEDVKRVLADLAFSRAATAVPDAPRLTETPPASGGLFTMDPPEHTRLRRLVAREFTNRRVEALRPRIQEIADRLLDEMAAGPRPVDLVQALALPLPIIVICELLGVPYEDREKFRDWSSAMVSLTLHTPEVVEHKKQELAFYFAELVERKRAEPGDDLFSALVTAHDDDGKLDLLELIIMGITIIVAGTETTTSTIGTGTLALLRHPEIVTRLRDDPSKIDAVVEEILRTCPIGDGGPQRVTLEDVEVAGVAIPKNSLVMAAIPAANHDPFRFADPDRFDIDRGGNPHLAFGHGIHHCLGASLARAELQITISSLFRRFPDLRAAVPVESLQLTSGMIVHSLRELPVTW
ncbi:cytochrome P450 [Microbispora sp. NPDC049125]|uniref:cytochrome P450 n=1 Tax=Microbispora sp. NPDC049125 TaxID=3154929 RepID=UPI003466F3E2